MLSDMPYTYLIPYFVIYFAISTPIIFNISYSNNIKHFFWTSSLIVLVFFIGFRDVVGGDWHGYLSVFKNNARYFDITFFDISQDYGYNLFSWLFSSFDADMAFINIFTKAKFWNQQFKIDFYIHNFIMAAFFIYCLNKFIKKQDNFCLALVVSIPYIITIIAMGYIRQSVAFSFLLLAIVSIIDDKKYHFVFYIILGSLFHKSLALMGILIFFSNTITKRDFLLICLIFLVLLWLFREDFIELYKVYISDLRKSSGVNLTPIESYGAKYRVYLAMISAFIFIFFNKKLSNNTVEKRIFLFYSFVVLSSFVTVNYYSTFTDRTLVYFTPLQIVVLSRLGRIVDDKYIYIFNNSIVFGYAFYYYVWFEQAVNAPGWLPYQNVLFK